LFLKTTSFTSSNHLPSILHLLPQYYAKNHLYVLDKRIIPIIIAIQPHLVGIDEGIVVLPLLSLAGRGYRLLSA
jgi:hypothetical protein